MDTLPPELILYLIPFLPLTTLIAARNVNTRWRTLAEGASLHPARKTLLDLYLAAIVHPQFPSLVEALWPHVRAFDREAYLADLTARGCVLPDLFELWILEWPSSAMHFWAWPGLPKEFQAKHEQYYDWGNALEDTSPTISSVPVPREERTSDGPTECLGLALWEFHFWGWDRMGQLWLIVDAKAGINDRHAGNLLWTYSDYERGPDGTKHSGRKRFFYEALFGQLVDDDVAVFPLTEFLDVSSYDRMEFEWVLSGGYARVGRVVMFSFFLWLSHLYQTSFLLISA